MKHEPKPLIEEHWHIQNLINSQQKRASEREYYRSQAKDKALRGDLINDAHEVTVTDFYCKHCQMDLKGLAWKQVEIDWTNTDQSIAFYKTKHRACGKWVMRHITDKLNDPFWQLSKAVAQDRGKHSIDLLQPFENNYNLVYGKK